MSSMELTDILLHLGETEEFQGTPGSPTLYQTSNFVFKSVDGMAHALQRENEVPFYTRGTNPTVQKLQKKLAALENMEEALVVASGSAAAAIAVLANVKSGDHILSVSKPYSWTGKLMNQHLPSMGITTTLSEAKNTASFLSKVQSNTKIIYLESPNSWTYEMQDLEAISKFARERGIITILDNSYATPLMQRSGDYGIDLVLHSATKYINGHSDVVAGILCGGREKIQKIFSTTYMTLGPAISPFDAWMMIRSLRTLPIRLKQIGSTTEKVLKFLDGHDKIKKVYHPKSKHYDQKDLADRYLQGVGGLLTIDLATDDIEKIKGFSNQLKKFKLGCSWGSFESLAFPAITIASSMNYDNPDIAVERVRLSIGLDEYSILIEDLEQALATI
ncbi:MAG: PLP-dependent transferase [Cyclobacteriaceae bacterium]